MSDQPARLGRDAWIVQLRDQTSVSCDRATAARRCAARERLKAIEMSRRAVAMRNELAGSAVGARAAERAQAAFGSLPTPAATVGPRGLITAANPAWRSRFGSKLAPGSSFAEGWQDAGGNPAVVAAVEDAVRGAARTDLESSLDDGHSDRLIVQVAPVTAGGSAAVVVLIDITVQSEYESRLLFEASHDPLTGLANRTWFLRELDAATLRRARYGARFGLVYLDLNGFKPVNDVHGHAAGDEVLRQLAKRWSAVVRAPDLLARVGGDEFVVLATHLESDGQLTTLAERLSEALTAPFTVGALEIGLSTAFGAVEPPMEAQPDEALGLADHAMYEHKRTLRDRPSSAASSAPPEVALVRDPAAPVLPSG